MPYDAGCAVRSRRRSGSGWSMISPRRPCPDGQLADLDDLVVGHAVVDEGPQPRRGRTSSTPSAAYCASTRLLAMETIRDSTPSRREVGGHRDDRVEEQPQPVLLVEDPVDPVEHLAQQVVELDAARAPPRRHPLTLAACPLARSGRRTLALGTCGPLRPVAGPLRRLAGMDTPTDRLLVDLDEAECYRLAATEPVGRLAWTGSGRTDGRAGQLHARGRCASTSAPRRTPRSPGSATTAGSRSRWTPIDADSRVGWSVRHGRPLPRSASSGPARPHPRCGRSARRPLQLTIEVDEVTGRRLGRQR